MWEILNAAFILINSELGKEESLIKELRDIDGIKEVHYVYGVYDIIAKVEAKNMGKLIEMIAFKIRRLRDVRSTLTMTVVDEI